MNSHFTFSSYWRSSSKYVCAFLVTAVFIYLLVALPSESNEPELLKSIDFNLFHHTPKSTSKSLSIQIIIVIEASTNLDKYKHAINSVQCYCQAQSYDLLVVRDSEFTKQCPHHDKFFRRHCVVAHLIHKTDYSLFIDADIGVVNPDRRIEEFVEEDKEIVFYDRFYNREVMAGSYLVRNSEWSRKFLEEFADYENNLPESFHGTDNGALHIFLLEKLFPDRRDEYKPCVDIYHKSKDFSDLFAYESCCRAIMGIKENFGRIKILKRGTGWCRDNWLTNSMWSPSRDFMIHGWKLDQLREYTKRPSINTNSRSSWYNPFNGDIDLNMCTMGNVTWSYDPNLIVSIEDMDKQLYVLYLQEQRDHYESLAKIPGILTR